MEFLLSWLVLALAVWLAAAILPGVHLRGSWDAIWVAALFGILNFFLGWLLFAIFAIGTLGIAWLLAFITRWIIDAIILKLADGVTDRLEIDNFGWALGAAALMSLFGTLGQWLLGLG